MLELILNRKIKALQMTRFEDTLLPAYESRGIRMDVYTEDEDGVVYDIEMQALPDENIAKRSRYYHAAMDIEDLAKGNDYSSLRKSFVIFICKEKIGDEFVLPVYTFLYRSEESPEVYLNDETWTIYVNACCEDPGLSPELNELLHYIRTGTADDTRDSFASRLRDVVEDAKKHRKWSVEYMWWEDELKHREFILRQQIEEEKQRADAAEQRADAALLEVERLKKLLNQAESAL